ncbi:MAG: TolC family protein, partial [Gemmatimonadetes bacterium]|nr:TolC family protein [Gemmatimonadota bacterium]
AQRLLTTQQLLPFAEAKVAGVADRGEGVPPLGGERLADNYKGALTVRTPLVFARESGRWGAAGDRLGIQRLERDRLRRDVELDVRGAVFDLAALEQLLVRQRETVRLARLLRDAEQRRFENGESTLLVVNLRERLVLDESVKLAALEAKVVGARGALVVATGNPSLLGTAP